MGLKIGNIETYGIIYKIENLVNGKVYIGQTTSNRGFDGRYQCKGKDIERVYNYHKNARNNGHTPNDYLLNSIEKYGLSNFKVYKIFDIAFSLEELNIKEELWIKYYNSTNKKFGYNFRYGGDNYEYSESSKVKLGINVICINTNKIYKSLEEASKYYNISRTLIKNTLYEKRNKDNLNKYLFRHTEENDFNKNYKRCAYCGNLFKLHKINNSKIKNRLNYNEHYCNRCKNKNNKLPKGMTKVPIKIKKQNNKNIKIKINKYKNIRNSLIRYICNLYIEGYNMKLIIEKLKLDMNINDIRNILIENNIHIRTPKEIYELDMKKLKNKCEVIND